MAIETKLSEVEEGRGSTLEQRDVCVEYGNLVA
jgi:hypothetical protein